MLINGVPEEGVFTTTVPALGSGTGLALILCDGFSPGTYTLTLQAMSSDGPATFMDRTLSVEVLPG